MYCFWWKSCGQYNFITCLFLGWARLRCRENGEKDVTFKVSYCGICHSDLHMVKNEWGISSYPLVPGYALAHRRHLILLII